MPNLVLEYGLKNILNYHERLWKCHLNLGDVSKYVLTVVKSGNPPETALDVPGFFSLIYLSIHLLKIRELRTRRIVG